VLHVLSRQRRQHPQRRHRKRLAHRPAAAVGAVLLAVAAGGAVAASQPASATAAAATGTASGTSAAHTASAASATGTATPHLAPPTDPAPAGDAFYTPPNPLPAGQPGDIIRWRPSKAGPLGSQATANAWQVMYLSTNALGKPDAVTGTVLVPKAGTPSGDAIVGLAPGTQGVSADCAASQMINNGQYYEQSVLLGMLKAGYAVAEPDYEGYHDQPAVTYMVGQSLGPALIDAVRAAQRLPASGLSATAQVAFRGHSEGGAAALWAGQMQPTYAPELKLVGVVAGEVPANLSSVAFALDGQYGFAFEASTLIGLDHAYPELNLNSYLNDAGKTAFADMQSGKCVLDLLNAYQGKKLSDYTTTSPLGTSAWLTRVGQNSSLGSTAIKVPVFQYHGTTDELVPFQQAAAERQKLCTAGTQVTWTTYDTTALNALPIATHLSPMSWADSAALSFIADRVAGKPATSNC
jgi:hypothetical protein